MSKNACTLWPDKFWIDLTDICTQHDKRYATHALSRKDADREMYFAVASQKPKWFSCILAEIMYVGIRLFGWVRYNKYARSKLK